MGKGKTDRGKKKKHLQKSGREKQERKEKMKKRERTRTHSLSSNFPVAVCGGKVMASDAHSSAPFGREMIAGEYTGGGEVDEGGCMCWVGVDMGGTLSPLSILPLALPLYLPLVILFFYLFLIVL